MRIGAEVVVSASPVDAFNYLADPHNRPEWQRTLRSVEVLDPSPPHVGQRWRDFTSVGAKPLLWTTELQSPGPGAEGVWAERGEWGGVEVDLRVRFVPVPEGTKLVAAGEMRGRGGYYPIASVVGLLANSELAGDLRRAGLKLAAG